MQTPTTTSDPLAVHRAVMAAAGPEALAGIAVDLTADQQALFDGWHARTAHLSDAELAAIKGWQTAEVTEMRRLLALDLTTVPVRVLP